MASLALMVFFIFLSTIVAGPISLIFGRLGFDFISKTLGVIAIVMGAYWLLFAPFPVSVLGLIGILTGGRAFYK
jgi:hypothetical protein